MELGKHKRGVQPKTRGDKPLKRDPSRLKVRSDLNLHPIQHEGENLILVEDPLGLIQGQLVLTQFAAALLSLMDGNQTLGELVEIVHQATQKKVPPDVIRRHIDELAQCGLMEDEKYFDSRQAVFDDFKRQESLTFRNAGTTYPGKADELRPWLDRILDSSTPSMPHPPRLIIAPHIDFRVNTETYGKAYSQLKGHGYDRVILMGTGHSIRDGLYCPTWKDLSSPLGTSPTDKEAVQLLMSSGDGILSDNDYAHHGEHALEFQIIFLQHLLGTGDFEVIPILCGSLHSYLCGGQRKEFIEDTQAFLEALRLLVNQPGKRTLVVGGIDFSHVGTRFSHSRPASAMLEETRCHDRDLIDAFIAWDADRFWKVESESEGSFHVCGFSTMATLLEILNPGEVRCLDYSVWDDSPTGSAVTFAALAAC